MLNAFKYYVIGSSGTLIVAFLNMSGCSDCFCKYWSKSELLTPCLSLVCITNLYHERYNNFWFYCLFPKLLLSNPRLTLELNFVVIELFSHMLADFLNFMRVFYEGVFSIFAQLLLASSEICIQFTSLNFITNISLNRFCRYWIFSAFAEKRRCK